MRNPVRIVEMENISLGMTLDGVASIDADRADIATLAYQLRNDRGCPIGSPDEDWFQVEMLLLEMLLLTSMRHVSHRVLTREQAKFEREREMETPELLTSRVARQELE